jgi:hypothetical protein
MYTVKEKRIKPARPAANAVARELPLNPLRLALFMRKWDVSLPEI